MCVGGHAAFTRVTNGVRTGYCSAENQNVVVRNVVIHSGGAIDPPAIPARSYNYFWGLRALQAEQGGLHGLPGHWRSPPLSALRPCTLLRPDPRSRAKSRQAASSPHRWGLAHPIRRRTPAATRSLHRTARPIVLRHAMPWPYRKVNRDASTTVHRDTDTHAVEHQQTNPPVHRSIRHNENVTSGYVRASEVNQ
jgi:hypothetical protein